MNFVEAVNYLCSNDAELEAISVLLKSHERKHKKQYRDLCNRTARLSGIRKLNKAHHKDEAIDALADLSDDEEDGSTGRKKRDCYRYI